MQGAIRTPRVRIVRGAQDARARLLTKKVTMCLARYLGLPPNGLKGSLRAMRYLSNAAVFQKYEIFS